MVERADVEGAYCIQCELVTHKRQECKLDNSNTACERCVLSNRACAKLIKDNDELKVAYLPLADEHRENNPWQELGHWVKATLKPKKKARKRKMN